MKRNLIILGVLFLSFIPVVSVHAVIDVPTLMNNLKSQNGCESVVQSDNNNLVCITKCGNGKIDSGEQCDPGNSAAKIPPNLNGMTTCANFDPKYTSGTVNCKDDCTYDTSNCS